MLSEKLRKLILILFHLLLIITPFFFTWVNEELFEVPKMLLTYGFTIILAALWSTRMVVEKRVIWRKTKLDWPIIIFFLSQLAATIFSIHFRTSIFGYYTRFHGGLLSTIAYITLFYTLINNIKRSEIKQLFLSGLVTAFLISLYGIFEHFGHSFSCKLITGQFDVACWVQDVQNRVYATFGQPNWLAAYLITLIPISLVLAQQAKRAWLTILLSINSIVLFVALLYTRSRSGIAGFFLSLIILILGWWWLQKSNQKKVTRHPILLGLIGLMLSISMIHGTALTPSVNDLINQRLKSNKESVKTTPPITESEITETESGLGVDRLSAGGTDSGEIRKIVWTGAIEVWKRYPLFGSGVATFAYSYYQDRPQAHNLVSEWDFLYNKAHNEFLNFLATTGLVGFLAYLGLLGSFSWLSLAIILQKPTKEAKKTISQIDQLLVLALFSGLSALSVSNFFGFSTVVVSILLFLYLGSLILLQQAPHNVQSVRKKDSKKTVKKNVHQANSPFQVISFGLITLISILLLNQVRKIFVADKSYASGQSYLAAGLNQEGITRLQKAVQLRPREALFHDKLANTYSQLALVYQQQEATASALTFKKAALNEAKITQELNPRHLNFYKSHARVLIQLSSLDRELLKQARDVLLTGIQLAPTDAKLLYNLALIQLELGEKETGLSTLRSALKLKPNYLRVQEKLEALTATGSATENTK